MLGACRRRKTFSRFYDRGLTTGLAAEAGLCCLRATGLMDLLSRELAAGSSYAADVHFLGHKGARELLPVYAFANAFVLPSTREPWGLVVNEAMAASLPVIVSNRCGCAEDLVQHGRNGFVFDPNSDAQLTSYLALLSSLSIEERQRLGECALERIAVYSPQNFGQEVAAILNNGNGFTSDRPRPSTDFSEVYRGNA